MKTTEPAIVELTLGLIVLIVITNVIAGAIGPGVSRTAESVVCKSIHGRSTCRRNANKDAVQHFAILIVNYQKW